MDNGDQLIVRGRYKQKVYDKLKWTVEGGNHVLVVRKDITPQYYEVFSTEYDLILASLDTSLIKVEKGKDSMQVMELWVKQYGFLGVNPDYERKESLDDFWQEVKGLMRVWRLYALITQYIDSKTLSKIKNELNIEIIENDVFLGIVDNDTSMAKWTWDTQNTFQVIPPELKRLHNALNVQEVVSRKDYEEFPERCCQLAVIRYISRKILARVSPAKITFSDIEFKEHDDADDVRLVQPYIKPNSLLQALYLRLMIAVSDTRNRICPCCGRVFLPEKSNQKYCDSYKGGPRKCFNKTKRKTRYIDHGK